MLSERKQLSQATGNLTAPAIHEENKEDSEQSSD
jgi:hypothetical protein